MKVKVAWRVHSEKKKKSEAIYNNLKIYFSLFVCTFETVHNFQLIRYVCTVTSPVQMLFVFKHIIYSYSDYLFIVIYIPSLYSLYESERQVNYFVNIWCQLSFVH